METLAQLTLDTTFSANWVIAIILAIVGFLLVRILNRIEGKLDQHDDRIKTVEQDVAVLKAKE